MRWTSAWSGLGVALIVGAIVRWTWPAQVEDLRPRPDALEYEEAARNLAAGEGYCLIVDGGRYPPRYPPGFSALLVPAMWLSGGTPGSGTWVVLGSALTAIAATWALGALCGGSASAVVAAMLLALAPLHVRWSRLVMSDVPTSAATVVLALGAIVALQRGARPRTWLALGMAIGLTALLRTTCALFALPVAVALALRGRLSREGLLRVVAFGCGFALGLVPTTLYGLARFGSPLASGYDYWVTADFFGWAYVTGPPAGGGHDSNSVFYARQLVGAGSLYPWPIAVLVALGLVRATGRPGPARLLAGLTAGTVVVLLVTYVPFFWQWDRFLLPVLPLLLATASLPFANGEPSWLRLIAAALALTAVVDAAHLPAAFAPPTPLHEAAALRAIAASVEPNAAVMIRSNVFFASRLLRAGTDRVWLPLGPCEHRALIHRRDLRPYAPAGDTQDWILDAIAEPLAVEAVEAAISALLSAGRPVYFVPPLQKPFAHDLRALLSSRFMLVPVGPRPPFGLLRVLARSPDKTSAQE